MSISRPPQGPLSNDEGRATLSWRLPTDPLVLAAIHDGWRKIFPRGEDLAILLTEVSRGDRPYSWQDDHAYRTERSELLRAIIWLVSMAHAKGGEVPIGSAEAIASRLVDEAFPPTLSDPAVRVHWYPALWERLQGAVLTFFDAVGFDPTSTAESVSSGAATASEPSPIGTKTSPPPRRIGRPSGSHRRAPKYYRDRFLDLRDILGRQPKQREFLRYIAFIEDCEAAQRRASPKEIRDSVIDPAGKEFSRDTLSNNLQLAALWPWTSFVEWATPGEGDDA